MKWAFGLRRIRFCRKPSERAVIRDGDPGADRNRDNEAAGANIHIHVSFWSARTCPRFGSGHRTPSSSRFARAQTFSSGGSINGPAVPETKPSGGMVPLGSIGWSPAWPNCGCSTRVANSIAVNNNAAAK